MRTHRFIGLLGGLLVTSMACDAIEPNNRKKVPTPAEILEGEDGQANLDPNSANTPPIPTKLTYDGGAEGKFFRTGNEYVYAVAKTVDITGSELRRAADYQAIDSKFFVESQASEENLASWASAVTAYSLVASEACRIFLEKEEAQEMNLDEISQYISNRAFIDQAEADAAIWEAAEISGGLNEAQKRQATCMTLVASANILF